MIKLNKTDIAWSFYDFANSAYALIVMTIFYPLFFIEFVSRAENPQAAWGFAVAGSIFLVAILAPILGSIVDRVGGRRKLFSYVSASMVILIFALAYTGDFPGIIGTAIFILVNTTFGLSLFLYDSLLVDSRPSRKDITLLSGFGWALGYIGGPLCVGIIYILLNNNVPSTLSEFQIAFFAVVGFFVVFALPAIWFMPKEIPEISQTSPNDKKPVKKLFWLIRNFRENKHIGVFLIAIYFITDGLVTIVYFISIYSKEALGLSLVEIVYFLTMVQVIGVFATFGFSYIAQKIGEIKVLILCSVIWTVIVILLYSATNKDVFYVIALLTGLVVGSTPAVARGFFARIIPAENRAELFGFNAFASRLASVVGPIIFVIISAKYGLRPAMLSVIPFFFIGASILIYFHLRWPLISDPAYEPTNV